MPNRPVVESDYAKYFYCTMSYRDFLKGLEAGTLSHHEISISQHS